MIQPSLRTTTLAALLGLAALTGCQRSEVGERTSQLDGTTRVAAIEPASDLSRSAQDARRDIKQAADVASDKVADAIITTTVNGELAKDADLSALRINVDTSAGNVSLHGTAPDANARDKATRLAAGVKGVQAVDNQLQVPAGKK